MDCNDTKTFMNEWARMCDYYEKMLISCEECQLNQSNIICTTFVKRHTKEAIPIIQKWSDEHPIEIDWTKVPVDTPVLVRNDDDDKWKERYFLSYLPKNNNYKFIVFSDGFKKEDAINATIYRYCKIAPQVDPTPFLKDGD